MGELKITYSDKKVTPFGEMKLLKYFTGATCKFFNPDQGIPACS